MDFFRLQQEENCFPYPYIEGLLRAFDPREAVKSNGPRLRRQYGLFVQRNENNIYTDVLDKQNLLLVTAAVRKVFDLYSRDIRYITLCLVEKDTMVHHYYYLALCDEVDCLHDDSVCNRNRSVFESIVLDRRIQDRHIFEVKHVDTRMVIVSLQVAESLLRRNLTGIKLTPVTLA